MWLYRKRVCTTNTNLTKYLVSTFLKTREKVKQNLFYSEMLEEEHIHDFRKDLFSIQWLFEGVSKNVKGQLAFLHVFCNSAKTSANSSDDV